MKEKGLYAILFQAPSLLRINVLPHSSFPASVRISPFVLVLLSTATFGLRDVERRLSNNVLYLSLLRTKIYLYRSHLCLGNLRDQRFIRKVLSADSQIQLQEYRSEIFNLFQSYFMLS